MGSIRRSIFYRFVAFSVLFLCAIGMLAATSVYALMAVTRTTQELEQKWLGGATLLGQMQYSVSAFRLDEGYRALVPDNGSRAFADAFTSADARHITALAEDYHRLLGDDLPQPDFNGFLDKWAAYQTAHNNWVTASPGAPDLTQATYGSALDEQYQATNSAIEQLIDRQRLAAVARTLEAQRLRRRVLAATFLMCACTLGIAGGAMLLIARTLIYPLRNITHTLNELAKGHHQIEIPERHRRDEIGAMAAACEAFRVNVLALDEAHAETRAAKEQASLMARHDALTGLPNRRVFSANLEEALARALAGSGAYSIFLLDLDEFKRINDIQGHHVGDAVLCEVARRLNATLPKTDTVARLGGDEFAIIAAGETALHHHLESAKRLANKLLSAIRQPILFNGTAISIGFSIGIALCRDDAIDASGLLRSADIAMYRAKQSGRRTFRFFEQSMDDEMRAREAMEHDLIFALRSGQIQPHFQPLFDIARNGIRGFEALARWNHPEQGFIPPDVFVPIIEHLGLMSEFTTIIMRQAARAAREWPADIRLAVNFSPSEFNDPQLPGRVLDVLEQEGLAPCRFEVEITETALVADLGVARQILTEFKAAGIAICLDDFGTGYSSLCHLHELRFDKVKIDRSFVQSMQSNEKSEKIIDAILSLTKSLGLLAVAEGIEDAEMGLRMSEKGCAYGQGFHLGRPMSGADTLALLNARVMVEV